MSLIANFRKYKLPMSHIIPFPKRNDPMGVQDFGPGKQVLALYPGTTALYRATVVQPRKVNSSSVGIIQILILSFVLISPAS